jgi:hypothetical protein
MGKDWRQQIYVGFVADIEIKILGAPLGPGMPFLDSNTFLPGFSSRYDAIHGWMDGKFHEKQPGRPFLYVISCT